jgi:hypothetical protein
MVRSFKTALSAQPLMARSPKSLSRPRSPRTAADLPAKGVAKGTEEKVSGKLRDALDAEVSRRPEGLIIGLSALRFVDSSAFSVKDHSHWKRYGKPAARRCPAAWRRYEPGSGVRGASNRLAGSRPRLAVQAEASAHEER